MLRIERTEASPRSENLQRDFATLDDVPDFALESMSHLYNYLIRPFQKSYGVVIHGHVDHIADGQSKEEWGRHVQLPSGEKLQLKFAPICMLQDFYDGIALISVRLITNRGTSVRTCIMFPPETDIPPAAQLIKRTCDLTAPRGLHLLMVSFFDRHDPMAGKNRLEVPNWTIDPFGYGSVRSTTFSIASHVPSGSYMSCKKTRRNEFLTFDHSTANIVAPGSSQFEIAAECVDRKFNEEERRASEPINPKHYDNLIEDCVSTLCVSDNEVGKSAMAASISICELLSGEGILSMLSHDFFKNALPTSIKSPLGLGLIICMAVRIAMVPGRHGQKNRQVSDQIASAELKTLFETNLRPLPILQNMWAIDVVIALAKKHIRLSQTNSSKQKALELTVNDQLVYWFRVGQAIISGLFGPGSSMDYAMPGSFGTPWRFYDPLIAARDAKTIELGVAFHNLRDKPRIDFVNVSKKRSTLIRLMFDTEKYLRTGVFENNQLAPTLEESGDSSFCKADNDCLHELILSQLGEQMQMSGTAKMPSAEDINTMVKSSFNKNALACAKVDLAEAITAGPVVHFKHKVGAYLISESQESPCCDCEKPVHVLQGVVLAHAFGECVKCHAKRCLDCSSQYNARNMFSRQVKHGDITQLTYGNPCKLCGMEAPTMVFS